MVGTLLALALFGFYLSWRATRLHRLHHRVDTARAGLEAALLRRRDAALALAAADPGAFGELAGAAGAARDAGEGQHDLAESTLSRVLRASLESHGTTERWELLRPQLAEVEAAAKGVHMARTFYNGAVSDTRRARRSRLVRAFRLAGTAPLPDFFEIDDQPPRMPLLPVGPDTL
ncbi:MULTISPECIES: hypothetical protein [unclassified Nocardiopsis]|uniref:hypothetical protein n=1 Tax=unclassified Nocardiopsis TaxID=2649073 RepID=UPI0018FEBBB0|nr:hypothetical protein [Nocardiopsis sp. TSRI0078]